jgi:ABC-2 type transport system permease protein
MLTELISTLRKQRGQIIGWGLSLAALGLMLVPFYESMFSDSAQLLELLEGYPEEFTAFFGDFTSMNTPQGFLGIEFFSYMPLLLGIFAALVGSGLIVNDEENGRLDLIASHPISRSQFFFSRILAFVTTVVAICMLGWLGMVIPLGSSGMDVTPFQLMLPFLPVLTLVLLYGSFALLLSLLLPSRRLAASVTGMLIVADFFVEGFSKVIADLEPVAKYLPTHYYQGGDAMDGIDALPVIVLLGISLALCLLALWRYQRRDIRVGGEGGWGFQWPRKRVQAESTS